jgi:hypothetical protein
MRHGAMLLCSGLNLIFEHGRIFGSGKVNGAEAKWTWPSFFRSRVPTHANQIRFLEFKPLHAHRFAHGVLICKLVGFSNSFYRGTKKSRSCHGVRGRWSVVAGGRRICLLRPFALEIDFECDISDLSGWPEPRTGGGCPGFKQIEGRFGPSQLVAQAFFATNEVSLCCRVLF